LFRVNDCAAPLLGAIYAYPGAKLVAIGAIGVHFSCSICVDFGLRPWLLFRIGGHEGRMFFSFPGSCFSLPATLSLWAHTRSNRHSMGWRSDGHQSIAHHDCAIFVEYVDRSGSSTACASAFLASIFLSAGTILVQRQSREEPIQRTKHRRQLAENFGRWIFASLPDSVSPMLRLLL